MLVTSEDRRTGHLPKIEHDEIPCLSIVRSSRDEGWERVETRLVRITEADTIRTVPRYHTVSFALKGSGSIDWTYRGRLLRRPVARGNIWVVPAGGEHEFRVPRGLENLHWLIDPDELDAVAELVFPSARHGVELNLLSSGRDPRLWRLGEAMSSELRAPCPSSRLFVESLNQSFMVMLLRHYSSLGEECRTPCPELTEPRLRRVMDYIGDNLAEDISLNRLAREVGLSPWHFAKAFKRRVGLAPHQYVLEERVARAKLLLEDERLPLAEIARRVGFSSQSHLTSVFRRRVGATPGAFRGLNLGTASRADLS